MAVARPDVGAAIMLQLKSISDITSLVSNRVYLEWPTDLVVPTSDGKYINAILINAAVGGQEDDLMNITRVDIKCYGANKKSALDLWTVMDWHLLGADKRVKTSFTRASCKVLSVTKENGPLSLVDPDASNWRYTLGTYIFRYVGSRNV